MDSSHARLLRLQASFCRPWQSAWRLLLGDVSALCGARRWQQALAQPAAPLLAHNTAIVAKSWEACHHLTVPWCGLLALSG